MATLLHFIGTVVLAAFSTVKGWVEETGRELILVMKSLYWLAAPPYRVREFFRQLEFIGFQSLYLISVTGAFTGMVMTLQMDNAIAAFGAQSAIGGSVAVSLSRELAPVLAGLLVTGRAGSAMTAELGSMRMTEQVDALTSMAVSPIQYLVVPRVLATVVVMPMLALVYGFCGMCAGYLIWTKQMGLDGSVYVRSIHEYFDMTDLMHGVIKALVFGFLLSVVCCARGLYAKGGSRGVGLATTRAVVVSSFLILASDYVITLLLT